MLIIRMLYKISLSVKPKTEFYSLPGVDNIIRSSVPAFQGKQCKTVSPVTRDQGPRNKNIRKLLWGTTSLS
jgi:hypothetical protein